MHAPGFAPAVELLPGPHELRLRYHRAALLVAAGTARRAADIDVVMASGYGFGAEGDCEGEVVFNTSLTGYQEILTDPSYAGQVITMTYPHIGNVIPAMGYTPEQISDLESDNALLRQDLEKREEALKRLRELTLGQ